MPVCTLAITQMNTLLTRMQATRPEILALREVFARLAENTDNPEAFESFKQTVINFKQELFEYNLLHIVAAEGEHAAVSDLVELGIPVDSKNNLNETPLFCAAERGHGQVVEQLLLRGASVNILCGRGGLSLSPLHKAVILGHNNVVTKLLAAGADKVLRSSQGLSAAYYAVQSGHLETLKLLVSTPSDLIQTANKNEKVTGLMLMYYNQGDTLLHQAALHGKTGIAEYLINKKLPLSQNSKGITPLHLSIFHKGEGEGELIKLLVDNATPEMLNATTDYSTVPGWEKEHQTAAHIAAKKHDMFSFKLLAKAGADMEIADNEGKKPTEYLTQEEQSEFAAYNAALHHDLELLKQLAKLGIDLDDQDQNGDTPLDLLAADEQTELKEFMKTLGDMPSA